MKKNLSFLVLIAASLIFLSVPATFAQQVPLPANSIPQFVDPLPLLSVQGGPIETIVAGAGEVTINMQEFMAQVLPSTLVLPNGAPYAGTWVWGYRTTTPPALADTSLGPVLVVARGTSTKVRYVNNLDTTAGTNVLFWPTSVDQTLHWADPQGLMCNDAISPGLPPVGNCAQPYSGPIMAVVHLHGGEVPAEIDGSPDSWFTSDGAYKGHKYYTSTVLGDAANPNEAIYRYPNKQEAAPIWFHDHTLGATRLNVYAGMAGAYIITDNTNNPPPDDLTDPTKIIPLVIQDRMFDTNGQLYFPNIGLNPEHPFWVPEFVGDTIMVNGKTWPFLQVEPGLYRFLLLNGSNARAYTLSFKVQGKGSPQIWVISTDGGYLQNPVLVPQLTVMPGERYGVIVDFSGLNPGSTTLLQNSARTPFPAGAPVQRSTTGRIMEFRVVAAGGGTAPMITTFVPTATSNLRPTSSIVRLAPSLTTPVRRLTLNEVLGPGGPLEVLVNNTKWSGMAPGRTYGDFFPITVNGVTTSYSEMPKEGTTEIWEVINMTADAHPIHLHLVQFQLQSRQAFDVRRYTAAYNASFPGGIFRPAFGPPLAYAANVQDCSLPNAVCGGNPDVTPFLGGAPQLPLPYENGWKDTVIMYPGQVTRIAVRWAPTDLAAGTPSTNLTAAYPFDPSGDGFKFNYVWHCHIIDHEDNEMMRPDVVQPNGAAVRAYIKGTDY
jgi:spore coat protein A